ncbi:bcl-2-related protein A1 isoform 2-T2 [Thomomys bottae]
MRVEIPPTSADLNIAAVSASSRNPCCTLPQFPQASSSRSKPSKITRLLRNLASSVQREVEEKLQSYVASLTVDSLETARAVFNQVMAGEFEDGIVNWGRIVTVFAFSGVLIKKLPPEQVVQRIDIDQISFFVAEFITHTAGDWMKQNGGWENGFLKKFETKSCWLTFLEVTGQLFEMFSLLKQYY